MRVDISGNRNGVDWPRRGRVVELPDDEAAAYCTAGIAEPVAVLDDAESATPPPAEVRAEPDPRRMTPGPRGAQRHGRR
jgi:hypothetical protein